MKTRRLMSPWRFSGWATTYDCRLVLGAIQSMRELRGSLDRDGSLEREYEGVGPDGMRLGEYESYNEYLKSGAWRALRAAAFARDLDRCIDCGRQATEVHHRNYPRYVEETTVDDLVCLCRPCHELRPRTATPMDLEEMKEMTGRPILGDARF